MNQQIKKQKTEIKKNSKKDEPKLNYDMEKEVEDAFNFYDPKRSKYIQRDHVKIILGNFGFQQAASSQINDFLTEIGIPQDKQAFNFEEVIQIVTQKWLIYGGQKQEAEEMFNLFDVDHNKGISFNEINNLFKNYLDIQINENDIHDFITDVDTDNDQRISKDELLQALNYNFNNS